MRTTLIEKWLIVHEVLCGCEYFGCDPDEDIVRHLLAYAPDPGEAT